MTVLDLTQLSVREANRTIRSGSGAFELHNPNGSHSLACGLDAEVEVTIQGHAGYYCAGMNKSASVRVQGNVGTGVAENMMSGRVHVTGGASQSAGATAHGGLLVIEGDASARAAISLKGADVVIGGSAGAMTGFMAQAGRIVICGDAGEALGDSLYEARIFVGGAVASLGADCEEREMTKADRAELADLLINAGIEADPSGFRLFGSARKLYNFHIDDAW